MRILVVGGGGREHALVWKLAQSPKVTELYCAPGNAGISREAACVSIGAEDIPALVDFAVEKKIGLVVVGPEAPLVAGLVDALEAVGIAAFGPSRQAAMLEGSKAWAKEFMARHGIPTAQYRVFTEIGPAVEYARSLGSCAIKADGLAAGKGVTVADTEAEAVSVLQDLLVDQKLGPAGRRVVIEERLAGEEVSVLAFTDGKTLVPLPAAQDHKRAYDGDRGPNTGGMGAFSPPPFFTRELEERVVEEILQPVIAGMAVEGRPYRGVLYAGLMLTGDGPKVLEFNCRFGDPETQVLLPRLESDLVEVMVATTEGRLSEVDITWKPGAAACVVLAAGGYPGPYRKSEDITGLEELPPGVLAFHAGTSWRDGRLVTSGGRVLGITATAPTLGEAVALAYRGVEKVSFPGCHYRCDIGARWVQARG
ncbi:MAG: phosphoribosylamine--glycine ligase [Clostridia bacterium]|nr:MAG: phosphoribosylamine--glycine ligase [Clostridia bacterium]